MKDGIENIHMNDIVDANGNSSIQQNKFKIENSHILPCFSISKKKDNSNKPIFGDVSSTVPVKEKTKVKNVFQGD